MALRCDYQVILGILYSYLLFLILVDRQFSIQFDMPFDTTIRTVIRRYAFLLSCFRITSLVCFTPHPQVRYLG
jgi:hypothetical protein